MQSVSQPHTLHFPDRSVLKTEEIVCWNWSLIDLHWKCNFRSALRAIFMGREVVCVKSFLWLALILIFYFRNLPFWLNILHSSGVSHLSIFDIPPRPTDRGSHQFLWILFEFLSGPGCFHLTFNIWKDFNALHICFWPNARQTGL